MRSKRTPQRGDSMPEDGTGLPRFRPPAPAEPSHCFRGKQRTGQHKSRQRRRERPRKGPAWPASGPPVPYRRFLGSRTLRPARPSAAFKSALRPALKSGPWSRPTEKGRRFWPRRPRPLSAARFSALLARKFLCPSPRPRRFRFHRADMPPQRGQIDPQQPGDFAPVPAARDQRGGLAQQRGG